MNKPLTHEPSLQMSVQASGQPAADGHDNLDFLKFDRRDQEYEKAVRHSRRVRFLKIALPAFGGLVVVGIILAMIFNSLTSGPFELGSLTIDDSKLVMESPKLNGLDKKKRPFTLTASQAIQDIENPSRVELKQISAMLPVEEGTSANVEADFGIYDSEAKTLVLQQRITVETTDGMQMELEDADIDIEKGTLMTPNRVVGTSPRADITASSMTVFDNGNRIVFVGNVRMTVRPKNAQKKEEDAKSWELRNSSN